MHQTDTKSGIAAHLYSPDGIIWLATHKSPIPTGGEGPPSNTMCHWTPQVYLPNNIWIRQMV